MSDLTLLPAQPDVKVSPALVAFPGYSEYLTAANQIAEYINGLTLTDDNVKQVKSDLAAARRVTNALEARRKEIKKQILSDYVTFEDQIKSLTAVIGDAEEMLRAKVRKLEEQEREDKKTTIREIWDKRIWQYRINRLIPDAFDRWLTPQHLNKSTTMKSVEASMVAWLEGTEEELEAMSQMGDEYVTEYLICLDMVQAVKNVTERHNIAEIVSQETEVDDVATFIVTGKANIKLAEILFNENKINFIKK